MPNGRSLTHVRAEHETRGIGRIPEQAQRGVKGIPMPGVGTAEPARALALVPAEDEDLASQSAARLLISAPTQRDVEMLARRIHAASRRVGSPFVVAWARDLPVEPPALRAHCAGLLDAAAGGSLLINDVERVAPGVQDVLLEVLRELDLARRPTAPVRLISGTTVSLVDRVAAGTFSERLFYRLNIIHLSASGRHPGLGTHEKSGRAPSLRDA